MPVQYAVPAAPATPLGEAAAGPAAPAAAAPPAAGGERDALAALAVFAPLLAPAPGGGRRALLEVLGRVRDLRDPRGVRHTLAAVLAMAVAAVACGERSLAAIAQWAKCAEADQELLGSLGASRHPVTGRYYAPHEDTFDRVLGGAVDPPVAGRRVRPVDAHPAQHGQRRHRGAAGGRAAGGRGDAGGGRGDAGG